MGSNMPNPPANGEDDVQGEGDYRSARKFDRDQREFAADEARVNDAAKAAADALDGAEGEELERARKETAKADPAKKT